MDFLIGLNSKFENLKNPIMRKTMGKVATLDMAASVGGLKTDEVISALYAEIDKQGDKTKGSGEPADDHQDQILTDPKDRREALKKSIKDLHNGEDMEVLKKRFKALVHGVEAPEFAEIEQELMNEGLPAEEIKRLCEVRDNKGCWTGNSGSDNFSCNA